ncbi:SRPBCC family protein [Devosia sp.]|uniref:SRPBCC family protein n=1 Tax=Devosia sp. TaxID=1871048 RepID=UPI003A9475B4
MQYDNSIELDVPRDEAVALFVDPENAQHWQQGLKSREQLTGQPTQEGAEARLVFDMGGKPMEMTELVLRRELPEAYDLSYDARGALNVVQNRFTDLGDGRTRWDQHNDFQFTGMLKVMGWLMPGMFRKQSATYMDAFKLFAENRASAAADN